MIDDFLANLFKPDMDGGAASFGERFTNPAAATPFLDGTAMGSPRDTADPSGSTGMFDQILRKLSGSVIGEAGAAEAQPGMRPGMPPMGESIPLPPPRPDMSVPLPQARPDIESILGGARGPIGPAQPAAPAGDDIVARLAGLFGGRGNVQPSSSVAEGAASKGPVSFLGRLAGLQPGTDRQIRSSLAGGFAGGNPAFKGGAFMKGASGALTGGLDSEKTDRTEDVATTDREQKQENFERTAKNAEKRTDAMTSLYGAREKAAAAGGRAAWNKPTNERWKDAQKLIIDKQKSLYANINPLSPKAEREAQKAAADKEFSQFKKNTYQQYGLTEDGTDAGGGAAPAPGGGTPSSSRVVGDKEAKAKGLYAKGTYDDPAEPGSQEEFDALEPGTIFKNPADGRIMTKRK